jgi:hypothetical protein
VVGVFGGLLRFVLGRGDDLLLSSHRLGSLKRYVDGGGLGDGEYRGAKDEENDEDVKGYGNP